MIGIMSVFNHQYNRFKFNTSLFHRKRGWYISVLLLLLVTIGCSDKKSERTALKKHSEVSIQYDNLDIDLMYLEVPAFSGQGFFRTKGDTLLFFDLLFHTVSSFDSNGEFVYRKLGKGSGPGEIASFKHHGFTEENNSVFFGVSYDISNYDENWIRYDRVKFLDWSRDRNSYNSSDKEKIGTYSYNFINGFYDNKSIAINSNDEFYLSLWISPGVNPDFHGYNGNINYYKDSYAIGLADSESGKVKKVFGYKPDVFVEEAFIPTFDFFTYDLKNDSLFVSYAPYDYIQVYDQNQELSYEFGVPGKNMDKDYPNVTDIQTSERVWRESYLTKGYYYGIFVDEKSGLTFRSYTKNTNSGGLQIYKGKRLIADLTVPKRFNVLGKIGEYYYADGLLDETEEILGIYKFKLK